MDLLAFILAISADGITDEQVQTALNAYIAEHPESVTTVTDGSITKAKLDSNLQSTVDDVTELKSAIANNAISALLHAEEIENTVQSILFDESGNVQSITHARGNVAIRTDEFTFADGTITETRTLNTGESLTIVTDTNTLQTTITYTAA